MKNCSIIKNLVNKGKIKTIHVNNKIVNITNISKYTEEDLNKSKIVIASKYMPTLVENDIEISTAVKYLKNIPQCYLITNKNKFISFLATHHACKQLVIRFLYLYVIEDLKFELGKRLELIYSKYLNQLCDILINNDDYIGNNPIILEFIRELMYNSKLFTLENNGRIRDIRAFTARNKAHSKTNRYYTHPFLFIVEGGILKTVELSSSSYDFRHINKKTKDPNIKNIILSKFKRL